MNPLLDSLGRAPSLEDIRRALFIQPHPDDNQVAAGGLIAKLIASGAEVWELTVCDDHEVDLGYTGEGLTTRQKEVLAAQQSLGMKNAGFLGFADKTRASVDEISVKIVEVIRKVQPDAVFTCDPSLITECHSDHIKVGTAVKYAGEDASCAFYPCLIDGELREDEWNIDMIGFYYSDKCNTYVDVTDYYDRKMEAIKCHESQTPMMLLYASEALDGVAGETAGCKYAEGYRVQSRIQMHCFNYEVLPYKEDED